MLNQQIVEQLCSFEQLIHDVDDLTDLRQVKQLDSSFMIAHGVILIANVKSLCVVHLPAADTMKQIETKA